MKAWRIEPAGVNPDAGASEPPPAAALSPRDAPADQARRVFLHGNGLPQRWASRAHFVVLDTGFGLGHNFLATWDAWRQDPARCARLHFVAVEHRPPTRAALVRAHAELPWPELAANLVQAWPALTPNLHLLDFEQGRVQLTLALGDAATLLPALRLAADAVYLDSRLGTGDMPRAALALLKAIGRRSAPGATAASRRLAPGQQAGLLTAGYELGRQPAAGDQGDSTTARFAPRHARRSLPSAAVQADHAVVIGAGLAGAAAAQALARQGLAVTVFERETQPAQAASGNPAGIFHGTLDGDDGTYARLYRAAALAAATEYRSAIDSGRVSGQVLGLLRLAAPGLTHAELSAQLQRLQMPPDYVQALDAAEASQLAGVLLRQPCWYYPGGGWVAPPQWVQHALQTPGIELRGGAPVQAIVREDSNWLLLDATGRTLARAAVLVLANAADAQRLLAPLGYAPWPLQQTRGQVTHWRCEPPSPLRLPLAGDGYALPLPQGLLCGATRQADDAGTELRHADHLHNLARLHSLTGLQASTEPSDWQGRVGWRLHSPDRLPIAGPLPALNLGTGQRRDQLRLLPRERGLFVLTALGARGLTLAPLLARLVAAQAVGTPWPLEQDLADAVDPARWLVRAARQAG